MVEIRTHVANENYRRGWDETFGRKPGRTFVVVGVDRKRGIVTLQDKEEIPMKCGKKRGPKRP